MVLIYKKKTDGDVTILGEVATDPVAAWAVQSAQVASLLQSLHIMQKTFPLLIESLRNSLMKVGMFNIEKLPRSR